MKILSKQNVLKLLFVVIFVGFLIIAIHPTIPVKSDIENNIPVNTVSDLEKSGEVITLETVASHNDETSCYTIVDGKVFDVTSAITTHSGGKRAILKMCGVDATDMFMTKHGESNKAQEGLQDLYIGDLK